ncbi:MAG: hypothetical protein LC775_01195 [Acidobacteria bacterium]|nr:hypothetical protein [Acidobacteriota bacterium]
MTRRTERRPLLSPEAVNEGARSLASSLTRVDLFSALSPLSGSEAATRPRIGLACQAATAPPGAATGADGPAATLADLDHLVAAYHDGATVYDLARQFGIHRTTVGKHLRARGVYTTPLALVPGDVPVAADLYRHGWSLARIAEKYGTTAGTVRTRLLEVGVRMRRPWAGQA